MAVSASGAEIVDSRGERYLDATGAVGTTCLGYGRRDVARAVAAQLEDLAFAHSSQFTTEASEAVVTSLTHRPAVTFGGAALFSSGSDAIEAGLKLARQYYWELGEPERDVVIARRQSYHGATLGTLAIGHHSHRREPYEPLLAGAPAVARVSRCFPYRDRRPAESSREYGQRLIAEIEQAIASVGSQRVMAVVVETVSGASLGAVAPPPGYLRGIRELCDSAGAMLFMDEVLCGVGRCGTFYAFEAEPVVPDIVALGKSLSGGTMPIGAVVASREIVETIELAGGWRHGHTYMGHPAASAAARAVISAIESERLLERVTVLGRRFGELLMETFADHPHVGDVRGRGMLWAVELVADRRSKAPVSAGVELCDAIRRIALRHRLICYPCHGTVDGERGHHIMLSPAFTLHAEEYREIAIRLRSTLDDLFHAGLLEQAA